MSWLVLLRGASTILTAMVIASIAMVAVHFYGRNKSHRAITHIFATDFNAQIFVVLLAGVIAFVPVGIQIMDVTFDPIERRIGSSVRIESASGEDMDISISWDVLGQDPVGEIEWGDIMAGEGTSIQYWVRNEGIVDVFLTTRMDDWTPPDANQLLTLSWDYANLNQWQIVSGDWTLNNTDATLGVSTTSRDIILVAEDPTFNYEIATRTKIMSSDGRPESQIIFRYENTDNYYFAGLGAWGYLAAIGTMDEGSARMLVGGGNPDYVDIDLDHWYDLKVRAAGSTFEVYVDDILVCTADDLQHGFGAIGLTSIHSDTVFDSFVAVDAFDPENVFFEDYFMGPPLEVSTSAKITLFLDAGFPDEPGIYDFTFVQVITGWDEPPA